jgi:hypothetical protein
MSLDVLKFHLLEDVVHILDNISLKVGAVKFFPRIRPYPNIEGQGLPPGD